MWPVLSEPAWVLCPAPSLLRVCRYRTSLRGAPCDQASAPEHKPSHPLVVEVTWAAFQVELGFHFIRFFINCSHNIFAQCFFFSICMFDSDCLWRSIEVANLPLNIQ